MISNAEILFNKLLNLLAIQAGTELTKDQIQLYDRNLAHYGYERVFPILDELLKEQRPRDPIPSIAEIERRLSKETQVSDKAQANTATQNLIRAVSRYGAGWPLHTNFGSYASFTEALLGECGELGVEVVRLNNGWPNFVERCNEAADNMEVYKAQLRDLCLSLLERGRLGFKKTEMPALESKKTVALIADLTKALPSLKEKN